jgi:molecular chaperone IbpA
MVGFDFSPYYRTTVGFDRMARALENAAAMRKGDDGFPSYDIETVGEDNYRLTFAVAGFTEEELYIEVRDDTLYVAGKHKPEEAESEYLYRGIAGQSFSKQFRLADYVEVESARLENGLLTIDLVREIPEAMKPRKIEITGGAPKAIKSKVKSLLRSDKNAA